MDAGALKASWTRVCGAGADAVALFFYSHLSLSHPQIRDLFPVSMAGQRDKFVSALGRIVASVDHADSLAPFLAHLGTEHLRFGARPEHYPPVGESLIATLAHFEGDNWTPQLAADWFAAYQQIAAQMIDAAARASNSTNSAVEDAR